MHAKYSVIVVPQSEHGATGYRAVDAAQLVRAQEREETVVLCQCFNLHDAKKIAELLTIASQ